MGSDDVLRQSSGGRGFGMTSIPVFLFSRFKSTPASSGRREATDHDQRQKVRTEFRPGREVRDHGDAAHSPACRGRDADMEIAPHPADADSATGCDRSTTSANHALTGTLQTHWRRFCAFAAVPQGAFTPKMRIDGRLHAPDLAAVALPRRRRRSPRSSSVARSTRNTARWVAAPSGVRDPDPAYGPAGAVGGHSRKTRRR